MHQRMNRHDEAQKAQGSYWSEEGSFGDYMILADECLNLLIGRDTTQTELEYLADLQESEFTPWDAAWIIAKECFSSPWKEGDVDLK